MAESTTRPAAFNLDAVRLILNDLRYARHSMFCSPETLAERDRIIETFERLEQSFQWRHAKPEAPRSPDAEGSA